MRGILSDERCHTREEFGAVPWDHLDPAKIGRDWSIGRSGYGLADGTWRLTTFGADGSSDVWELPPAVGAMLDMVGRVESRAARGKVRSAFEAFRAAMED